MGESWGRIGNDQVTASEVNSAVAVQGGFASAANEVARRRAIRAVAKEDGVSVDLAALQTAVDAWRKRRSLVTPEETNAYFEKHGVSHDFLEEWLEAGLLFRALAAAVTKEQVAAVWAQSPEQLVAVKLYRIVASDDDVGREVVAQVGEGADFRDLARELSGDERDRDTGGHLGWVKRADAAIILGDVADAVFEARVGQVIGPRDGIVYFVAERRDGPSTDDAGKVKRQAQQLVETRLREWLDAKGWQTA